MLFAMSGVQHEGMSEFGMFDSKENALAAWLERDPDRRDYEYLMLFEIPTACDIAELALNTHICWAEDMEWQRGQLRSMPNGRFMTLGEQVARDPGGARGMARETPGAA